VENNWLSVDEADKKKQLETKRDYLKQELTPAETKELADINQADKARNKAIKSVCTDGNKGGAACHNVLIKEGLGNLLRIGTAVTVLDKLSDTDKEYVLGVAATGRADLIEKLTPEQREAYNYMVAQDPKGLITVFPQPDRDETSGRLVNPAQGENKGTSLVTPDRSGEQKARNTGNNDGVPDTGENTTVTPIAQQNKDDLVYLAKGDKATSLSPVGAGRSGAFKEAKRQSGIPVSKHPDRVTPDYDRRGKLQPGKNYEFDIRDANGKIKTLIIREMQKLIHRITYMVFWSLNYALFRFIKNHSFQRC